MSTMSQCTPQLQLAARFRAARQRTLSLCEPLTPEDMMVQSCPEASPAKWHLAHTAWFFESFVLQDFLPGYRLFNPDFPWLFNSYYLSFASFPEKRLRASFSRPGLDEILRYRRHVDESVERLLSGDAPPEALTRIELGVNHEEQHQELLLTDIHHAFFTNPLRPAYRDGFQRHDAPVFTLPQSSSAAPSLVSETWEDLASTGNSGQGAGQPVRFLEFPGGMTEVGHDGQSFCYDNELPRHRVWLEPYALADRLVTCGEFADFIADGGYRRHELWLSAGWDAVQSNGWRAPLYWSGTEGPWTIFTLRGEQALERIADVPVSHVSYFEADAYARWAGRRLATELEWEAAARSQPLTGNLLDVGRLMPAPAAEVLEGENGAEQFENATKLAQGRSQFFGDCWEWTASAYLGYPGFKALPGSLGEYNGKFMSGQMVLRGGSCVTPAAHIRASYRNFFAPETRWQFSGIRLAKL